MEALIRRLSVDVARPGCWLTAMRWLRRDATWLSSVAAVTLLDSTCEKMTL